MIEQPTPPMDGECCESECSPCVWDIYYEELARWREAQAKQKTEAEQNSGQASAENELSS